MIYAALLPLGEAPLLASVRIGKWKPKCKSFSASKLEMGPTLMENPEFIILFYKIIDKSR